MSAQHVSIHLRGEDDLSGRLEWHQIEGRDPYPVIKLRLGDTEITVFPRRSQALPLKKIFNGIQRDLIKEPNHV